MTETITAMLLYLQLGNSNIKPIYSFKPDKYTKCFYIENADSIYTHGHQWIHPVTLTCVHPYTEKD